MKRINLFKSTLTLLITLIFNQNQNAQNKQIAIEWEQGKPQGSIECNIGNIESIKVTDGTADVKKNKFVFTSSAYTRLEISITEASLKPGPQSSIISVKTNEFPFSFFLRDINSESPVYIPEYNVIVTNADDKRTYNEIQKSIKDKKLISKFKQIESEPEESYENAAKYTHDQNCPSWLGISRDMRIFEVADGLGDGFGELNYLIPKRASSKLWLIQNKNKPYIYYGYDVGRGQGTSLDMKRHLEDGYMPIINTIETDEDITYHSTFFVSYEKSELTLDNLKGTHYLVADNYCSGTTFTDEQQKLFEQIKDEEINQSEETVFYFKCEATNNTKVPRYAYYKTLKPGNAWYQKYNYSFDPSTGFSKFSDDSIFCISKMNGEPLPNEETVVLLQPGEKVSFEFFMPHATISPDRAQKLFEQSFDKRYEECKEFWKEKKNRAASIKVPEQRIQDMIYAGLNHLDLITYGKEPDGTLAPSIGVYSPIGTESAPIIQYYLSMGLYDQARRSIQFFLDKQHDDGKMMNFGGYMIETGAVLWLVGEYYRYTKDKEWLEQYLPNIKKACEYLIDWREENLLDSIKGAGYGMISGKVADPDDHYHQFMLNAYAYLGLKRIAEVVEDVDSKYAITIKTEAELWKNDIRESLFSSMARSPIVPLGDGRWCPTVPPWPEATAPSMLYNEYGAVTTHGSFFSKDGLLGPLHLIFCEVLDPNEQAAKFMLDYHSELFFLRNAGFSQPYYSRHAWIELKKGMAKPFLKTYYNTFSGVSDRETYTFWEHTYRVSVHKTHEEGWFLMQTRWMLYMEDGDTLKLLSGIPRKWLEDGKIISIDNAASYFGKFNLKVNSQVKDGYIEATIECSSDRKPQNISLRIPHPSNKKPTKVEGGEYDPETETVLIKSFSGNANVKVVY